MLVEARVLGGEHGELHVRGQRRDRDHRAPLGEELGEERPVAREDARDLRGLVVPELGDARAGPPRSAGRPGQTPEGGDDRADRGDRGRRV